MTGVSIIIPTLNEGENIDAVLDAIIDTVGNQMPYEILVVDDGSTDDTRARAIARGGTLPVRLVARDEPTGGLSGAVVDGAREARYSVTVVMDGDGSHPASAIPDLVAPVLAGERDVVVGSRRVPGGAVPDWPWHRRFASRVASAAAWPISEVGDPMSGFFATTRERLCAVDPAAAGYKIGLEVMTTAGDPPRCAEVPIVFRDRQYGESKMGASTIVQFGVRLVALAGGETRFRMLRRYGFAAAMGMLADIAMFSILSMSDFLSVPLTSILPALLGAVVGYGINRWSTVPTTVSGMRRLWRAATIGLAGAALRGGIVALTARTDGALHWILIAACFLVPAGLNFAGSVFYVFSPLRKGDRHIVRWRVAAVAVALYALLMHLVYLPLPDLLPEEAYYWNYAQHPALSYLDHPPMVAWLIWCGTALLGDAEWAVRLPALLCWAGAGLFIYRLTRDLYDKSSAIVALMLVAVLPFFASTGLLMTPDAPLLLCWAATLYYLSRALVRGSMNAWWGVGLWLGLGMLSKYSIVLLGPATALFMLVDASARRQWLRLRPYLAAVIGIAIFTPVLIWNAQNEWASFLFQSVRRATERAEFGLPELLLASLGFMTPLGLIAAYRAVRPGVADSGRRVRVFVAVMTGVPLAVFVLASLASQSKANWTGPVWLAAVPAIGAMIVHGVTSARARATSRGWGLTVSAVVIGTAFTLHYLAIGLPGVGYREGLRMPVGWSGVARQVERIERRLREAGSPEPVAVGMWKYTYAAELAYYRRAPERTASIDLFGGPALMFERWPKPANLSGRPLVLVTCEEPNLSTPAVMSRVAHAEPIQRHVIHRDGKIVATFFTRVVTGYKPAR